MKPSFDYAALKFLMLWERSEKPLHDALSGKAATADDVRRSLKHLQVARNFAGIRDSKSAQAVIRMLEKVDKRAGYTAEQKVDYLGKLFQETFRTRNLSAASKLLWLRHRRPYVIYDSRAVRAIAARAGVSLFASYDEFVAEWRRQYERVQQEVAEAGQRLSTTESQASIWRRKSPPLATLVSQPWFLERVFDIYLWEFGDSEPGAKWIDWR